MEISQNFDKKMEIDDREFCEICGDLMPFCYCSVYKYFKGEDDATLSEKKAFVKQKEIEQMQSLVSYTNLIDEKIEVLCGFFGGLQNYFDLPIEEKKKLAGKDYRLVDAVIDLRLELAKRPNKRFFR